MYRMYLLLSTSMPWHEDAHVGLDVLNKRGMQNVQFGIPQNQY